MQSLITLIKSRGLYLFLFLVTAIVLVGHIIFSNSQKYKYEFEKRQAQDSIAMFLDARDRAMAYAKQSMDEASDANRRYDSVLAHIDSIPTRYVKISQGIMLLPADSTTKLFARNLRQISVPDHDWR